MLDFASLFNPMYTTKVGKVCRMRKIKREFLAKFAGGGVNLQKILSAMKKLFLVILAGLAIGQASAQTQKMYCQIVGTQKFAKDAVTVAIDFGQEGALRKSALGGSAHANRMVDETGKPIEFNSMVDAMNYMGTLGWSFEQAYVVTMASGMGGGQNVYHWLLSKDAAVDQSGLGGITTQGQHKQTQAEEQATPPEPKAKPERTKRERYIDDLYQ